MPNISKPTFANLVSSIRQLHNQLSAKAKHAVNIALTLRNWLIGYYIAEYELHGADKAKYGDQLMMTLSENLHDLPNCHKRQLYEFLTFYRFWPQIVPTPSAQLPPENKKEKMPTPSVQLPPKKQKGKILSLTEQSQNQSNLSFAKVPTVSALLAGDIANSLIAKLPFSMFKELLYVENTEARNFYVTECIKSNWSVRELKHQIGSMFYERTALSTNKTKMLNMANAKAELNSISNSIRDPYIFDFLGLKPKEIMNEHQLEDALLDKLQDFLLELGRGFCFEARQKRMLIGNDYLDVDLVFYHRILKCHVLIDLKDEPFSHENIGQLNTYVSYYQKNEMSEGDNPPIGILLCTQKNNELVEYALAGMSHQLFVSKYQLELPTKKDMEDFIRKQQIELDNTQSTSTKTPAKK